MDINKLARYIKEKGFTHDTLAEKSGLSKATIARILNGNNTTMVQIYKVINALEMPSDLILLIFFPEKKDVSAEDYQETNNLKELSVYDLLSEKETVETLSLSELKLKKAIEIVRLLDSTDFKTAQSILEICKELLRW